MSKSRDEIKGKRNNHLAANGLLKAKDGKTFDLTQYYIDNSPEWMRANLEIQGQILEQLKIMNLHLELITDENLNW
tara:strand:+ start:3885 stop:4112 length:228 start_codon:yes stop_codon:yes gene_type:complete